MLKGGINVDNSIYMISLIRTEHICRFNLNQFRRVFPYVKFPRNVMISLFMGTVVVFRLNEYQYTCTFLSDDFKSLTDYITVSRLIGNYDIILRKIDKAELFYHNYV